MREERRVITALFVDVVGSTALGERLDPEETKLIVNEAISRAIRAIERYGGTVKDLAGDGVLALFGAPQAHEDDPERALHAALEILDGALEQADEVRRGWGVEGFAVRVGVDTGEVVLGMVGTGTRVEYGAVGDPVNTAARLQSLAEPGTVLAGDATRRLAGADFRWGEATELKSKSGDAIRAHRLVGIGVHDRVRSGQAPRLVGREEELATATEAIEGLARGQGAILFVVGEPGIGKSRLIGELRQRAIDAGDLAWHEGRCVSYGEAMPYWPYRELLRDWLGVAAQDPPMRTRIALRRQLEAVFGPHAGEAEPYLATILGLAPDPDAARHLEQLSPESRQFRTFEVVEQLVDGLARSRPVVIVLEDLHWADPTSVQLTERLLGLTESAAVTLVLSHRLERDHPSWGLSETAARQYPHLRRLVELKPLGPDAAEPLLDHLLEESRLPPGARSRVLELAEGNPFFLEEIVGALRERGLGDIEHVDVPPTIGEVIVARIDRLPERAREIVTAASLLGRSFGVALLHAVDGGDREEIETALHDLQRLDLLREVRRWPEPEFRFRHALIQETAERTLVSSRRRELHARAAEWLEAHHVGHLEEVYSLLAHHWLAAEDGERAVRYLGLAGDRARDHWALDEAIRDYTTLVSLLDAAGRREESALTLFKLGHALHVAMRYGDAMRAWERAFEAWSLRDAPAPEPAAATLRIASPAIPADPDPHASNHWNDIQLGMQLNDRLVEAGEHFISLPALAERWTVSEDGLRYTFTLRSDARWNDGSPLAAADIAESVRRGLVTNDPAASVSIYFMLEGVEARFAGAPVADDAIGVRALDDRTVEFRLAAPAPYFLAVMNRPDANAARPGETGTGPFEVESIAPERVVLRRAAGYTGRRAGNVERVEWIRMAYPEALRELASDAVDVVIARSGFVPPHTDISGAVVAAMATSSVYGVFNTQAPGGGNILVRRALSRAIDRAALAALAGPQAVAGTGGIVPPALQGHTPDIAPRFEPEHARHELEASGYDGSIRLAALPAWQELAAAVADGWRSHLGLDVELSTAPAIHRLGPDGVDMAIFNWLPGYPDAEYYLRLLLHSASLTNDGGWDNPDFDSLIERARAERTGSGRIALYHAADRLAVHDECALAPLVYFRPFLLMKPWVTGYWEWGKSSASFADIRVGPASPRAAAAAETTASN